MSEWLPSITTQLMYYSMDPNSAHFKVCPHNFMHKIYIPYFKKAIFHIKLYSKSACVCVCIINLLLNGSVYQS